MLTYKKTIKKVLELPERVDKKKGITYSRASYWKENWNKDYYLRYVIDHGKYKRQKIIATFLLIKQTKIHSYEEASFFFSRNDRIAKSLEPFDLKRIEDTLHYLIQNSTYRIALETVGKFLEDDLELIDNKQKEIEPIIVLSNGEKIYDVKRLSELECENKIFWNGRKWEERS